MVQKKRKISRSNLGVSHLQAEDGLTTGAATESNTRESRRTKYSPKPDQKNTESEPVADK